MSADTDSMELVQLEGIEIDHDALARSRRLMARLVAVAGLLGVLAVVLVVLPLAGVTYPYSRALVPSLDGPANALLEAFGVTPVLVAVAGLTVVSLIRKLPYGIGAVIALVLGASLTTAAVRSWADGWVPASALPNGYVTACASLVCAATLVASARFLPMVWGLGAVAVATVSAAAVIGGSATVVGIVTTVAIVTAWWAGSSAVMLYSPVAAEREAQNPFDTAALALRRLR
ncbi:hypothetical protein CH289_16595 [Rhodococcus sp. RS1C4]|uniref:hypothetical protein n=1 Tax=Nocardiaceae TaxID=85025 RepID=UPI000377CBD1|nr:MULTISPECIES: hypothetical protein [Rhodococcus]OZC50078.1 hypothetical protein CH289_16595 [Rhodococcus sp. RS1C4]OZC51950.1 hypothetical protein CH267_20710 [Rhodococcus sp. 06-621-2]OZC76291.1 hypothetical protein CH282_25740 [Rhodococcus sp. 06-418-1B]OZE80141.1 hypothetical protein CH304_17235 [Rhodococcus sp. 15-649-1-2]OZF02706.1 hypothetical protein CH300_16735 [Rhodococcus sp. 15-1154-1]